MNGMTERSRCDERKAACDDKFKDQAARMDERLGAFERLLNARIEAASERANLVIDQVGDSATKALSAVQESLSAGSMRMREIEANLARGNEEVRQELTEALADTVRAMEAGIEKSRNEIKNGDLKDLREHVDELNKRPMRWISILAPAILMLFIAGASVWKQVDQVAKMATEIEDLRSFKESTLRWQGEIDAKIKR